MNLYFDTETTGLTPGRIIQLSYILEEGDKVTAKNFFFDVDYIPIEATKIHGFTTESIHILSNGKTFSDYQNEIYNDFISADVIIGHNVNFDIKFLTAEFSYLDIIFRYNKSFDTMQYFTPICKMFRKNHDGYKFPKLIEVAEFLEIYNYDVTKLCSKIFSNFNYSSHDSRFDTAQLYLCCKQGIKNV